MRSDRDTEGKDHLASRRGCLLLTSSDIVITPILTFSNAQCEIQITELLELLKAIIVLYNSSKPNFSLDKFRGVLNKIEIYLTDNLELNKNLDIILAGDFNFPRRIVDWVSSDEGLFADYVEGESDEKQGFKLLLDLANEHSLDQIVDKPTRESNILDLVFTDNPTIFQSCTITEIRPISDHNLIKFDLSKVSQNNCTTNAGPLPKGGISAYDLNRANKDTLRQALAYTNWDTIIGNENNIENTNNNFLNAVIRAAKAAGYQNTKPRPKRKTRRQP